MHLRTLPDLSGLEDLDSLSLPPLTEEEFAEMLAQTWSDESQAARPESAPVAPPTAEVQVVPTEEEEIMQEGTIPEIQAQPGGPQSRDTTVDTPALPPEHHPVSAETQDDTLTDDTLTAPATKKHARKNSQTKSQQSKYRRSDLNGTEYVYKPCDKDARNNLIYVDDKTDVEPGSIVKQFSIFNRTVNNRSVKTIQAVHKLESDSYEKASKKVYADTGEEVKSGANDDGRVVVRRDGLLRYQRLAAAKKQSAYQGKMFPAAASLSGHSKAAKHARKLQSSRPDTKANKSNP